jgi:hypothetical protein
LAKSDQGSVSTIIKVFIDQQLIQGSYRDGANLSRAFKDFFTFNSRAFQGLKNKLTKIFRFLVYSFCTPYTHADTIFE